MNFFLVLFLFLILFASGFGQTVKPVKISAGGVEFHYIEKGQGEPLILLHGGANDYHSWQPQIDEFSKSYRVISYSRRYNYPNKNPLNVEYRAAETDAEDLFGFVSELKPKRIHLVGVSYGALAGLIFAVKHPNMVSSMVLAEPPAHQLIRDLPGGETVYQDFINALKPAIESFRQSRDREAMGFFFAALGRKLDNQPPVAIEAVMQNAQAIKAINTSAEPFPKISKEKLRRLKIPILIITGENTIKIHKLVDEELARLLPNAKEVVIPKAGHATPRENPQLFNESVLKFWQMQQARQKKNEK